MPRPDLDIAGLERFHGHMCPGLAIGVRVAEIALREIGPHAEDEEVVAIVETDMCAVDAIQYFTGCTFGKGNLIHRDYGKSAYTFIRRSDGKAIRVTPKPESRATLPDERAARTEALLTRPADALFNVVAVDIALPERARLYESVACAGCDERVMETRLRRLGGALYCIPCFEARDRRV